MIANAPQRTPNADTPTFSLYREVVAPVILQTFMAEVLGVSAMRHAPHAWATEMGGVATGQAGVVGGIALGRASLGLAVLTVSGIFGLGTFVLTNPGHPTRKISANAITI